MSDAYNIAIKYLQGKYGKKRGFTSAYHEEIRKIANPKQRRQREKNVTDKDYDLIIQPDLIDKSSNDWKFWLLINQYYYGSEPKKELEHNLIENKIMSKE